MNFSQKIDNLRKRAVNLWQYGSTDVWNDRKNTFKVKVLKTINLSVRSFLSADIQSQACAMTYRTVLAIVPALAMLFALGRGFGLQTLIESELYSIFHAQREAISRMLAFVDSYLNQASEGIFVGIGILFLLWTLISLVSSVEDSFNAVWGVKEGRSMWRKITDYTAMLLILPVLMICAGGLNMLLSSTIDSIFHFKFLTPLVTVFLEAGSWVFTWLFFTAVYMLIPNVKVKFANAFIAGVLAGTGFLALQWIFVTGQMYVAKYNAIYGSVSFIPLMLIWLQLVWVITLSGAVLCYASQNIFEFDFKEDVDRISLRYREKVIMAVAVVIVRRFADSQPPITVRDIIVEYHLPSRLVNSAIDALVASGIVSRVVINGQKEVYGYQPAIEVSKITVSEVRDRLEASGRHGFIPQFDTMFPGVVQIYDKITACLDQYAGNVRLVDLPVKDIKQPTNN
ncbi:MAG: YihY/virulence factor BrkB family protein [Muribaculaceae bacterium]|nr:YihY/virulence factor BrkB family protein [Muribaculaceae bacterium]